MKTILRASLLAASMLAGCAPSGTTPVASPVAAVDEVSARAAQLEPRLSAGAISVAAKSDPANGPAFVRLARSGGNPKVVEGALEGMSLTYTTSSEDTGKNQVDSRYMDAVVRNLGNPDKAVRHWAITSAAKTQVGLADPKVIAALNLIARDDAEAAARVEALDALALGDSWSREEATVSTFMQAITGEPLEASVALSYLQGRLGDLDIREKIRPVVLKLLAHPDPAVRGHAALVTAELASDGGKASLAARLTPLLKDAHPYVRSQAALALGQLGYLPSAAALMPLLDDREQNGYDLVYRNLLGQEDRSSLRAGATSSVAEAALSALQTLSATLPKDRFILGAIDPADVDSGVTLEAQRARAWYAAHKKALKPAVKVPKAK